MCYAPLGNSSGGAPSGDLRSADRVRFDVAKARLRQPGARSITVVVKDLSRTGFRAEWPHSIQTGQNFWLTLPNLSPLLAKAMWSKNFEVGCRCEVPIHRAVFQTLLARHGSG